MNLKPLDPRQKHLPNGRVDGRKALKTRQRTRLPFKLDPLHPLGVIKITPLRSTCCLRSKMQCAMWIKCNLRKIRFYSLMSPSLVLRVLRPVLRPLRPRTPLRICLLCAPMDPSLMLYRATSTCRPPPARGGNAPEGRNLGAHTMSSTRTL
ncbi:hypothetical protein B0H11DRAFT_2053457 [Mycena galericulata]|nr:hypothetical protein B0H11DRAFT_2053457 [Mycena galericulata]